MRWYADAPHVDLSSLHARRPRLGKLFRLAGHAGVVAGVCLVLDRAWLGLLIGFLFFLWLAAWYAVVGSAWRASLVAAILLVALRLTFHLHQGAQP